MILDFFDRTLIEWIAPALFYLALVLELFFFLFFYSRVFSLKKPPQSLLENPVSICLRVRNEEDRVEQVLRQLLAQKYDNFEIIVVDDFSEDNTIQKVAQLAKQFPQVKFTSINQETNFSEKLAINLALKASGAALAIFLTPEVKQIDSAFLKAMNDAKSESDILIGYTNILPQKKFRNKLYRIERFFSFWQSATYSLAGYPVFYQDVNVLFNKELYFQQSGFRGQMNYHFANLELVFNDCSAKKVNVSINPVTFVKEEQKLERGDFVSFLRKRIQLVQQLGLRKRLVLQTENFSKFLFLGSFSWMLATEPKNWLFVVIPALLIMMVQFLGIKTATAHLNEEKIFLSSFVYIYIRPILNWYQAVKIYIYDKRNKWN